MDNTPSTSATRVLIAGLSLAVLAGCASTAAPVVYPMSDAKRSARAAADLQACRAAAEQAVGVNGNQAGKAGIGVARRGAAEFVDKAVESMVNGAKEVFNRARGAGAGAMAGSLTAVALNWNEPDGVYRSYVDMCLKDRGHKVLGWR